MSTACNSVTPNVGFTACNRRRKEYQDTDDDIDSCGPGGGTLLTLPPNKKTPRCGERGASCRTFICVVQTTRDPPSQTANLHPDAGCYLFKTIVPHWYSLLGIKRANHVHLKMRHKDHGVQTTQMYFAGKDQDDIRKHDHVFKSHTNADRLIVPKENPSKYADLDVRFDEESVCCRFDLAFFL